MPDQVIATSNKEIKVNALNGWLMLLINLGLLAIGWFLIIQTIRDTAINHTPLSLTRLFAGIGLQTLAVILLCGHFTLQPNEARALILFGAYRGTVRTSGFHWANPFYAKRTRISLRSHNLNSDKLKVNDKQGNPIEIGAVVVWRVADTAQALFDVVDYEK